MEGYIAEVRIFAGNFAPGNWLLCQGQLVSIAEYDTLYVLLGTTFGGDGQETFGLPNLSSRLPVGTGQGLGLTNNYVLGQQGGNESNTITVANLPSHTHPLTGSAGILSSGEDGHKATPVNNSVSGNGDLIYSTATDNTTMAPAVVALAAAAAGTASPQAIENVKPALAVNYIICTQGIFPTQS